MTSAATTPSQPSSANPLRAYSEWQKTHYPLELWWAISCFIALISLFHLVSLTMAYHSKHSTRRSSNESDEIIDGKCSFRPGVQSGPNASPRALRNAPSAVLSSMQMFFFRIRLPFHKLHRMNVAEMVVSISYLAALLIWDFINSRGLTVGLWANRAAHLATSQTPLIIALAGKNNIITLLTGISYEKLNVLHRMSARATLILIWVHAFGRWRLGLRGHFSLDEVDMRFGVVSMVAFTLAALLSVRPIRNIAYEAFLISHIILVAMYLVFGMLHVPEVKYRFWPAFAIWALDRLLRALRTIILNKLWINIFPTGKVEEANLERVSSDTVRLTVRQTFKWRGGQHAYIIAPTIAKLPFEAHPFTVASAYSEEASKGGRFQELVFIIRGRNGFTKRLLEASETRQSIPIVIDGPYGVPPRLSHYSTCIFLAGGSGVTYTLSQLLELVRQVKSGKAIAQRALFVWVIRNSSHIDWIVGHLQEAVRDCPPTLRLDLKVYVTQRSLPELPRENVTMGETTPVESKQSLAEKSVSSLTNSQVMKVLGGRPDIGAMLEEELSCAGGRVSIDVSGPSALADATRGALVACNEAQPAAVLRGAPRTTLHVETFGW